MSARACAELGEASSAAKAAVWGRSVNLRGALRCLLTLLELCMSSLRRGPAYLPCIFRILTDGPRRDSGARCVVLYLFVLPT